MSSENSTNSNSSASAPSTPVDDRPKREQIADVLRGKDMPAVNGGSPNPSAKARASAEDAPSESPSDRASKPESRSPETRPALEFSDDDEAPQTTAAERKFLKEFAKEAGISAKRAFGLMIDTGVEGEDAVSIGDLADHWRENRHYQQERDEFEYQRSLAQNKILADRRQNDEMAARMRQIIGDEGFERVAGEIASEQAERIRAARAQLLEFFPRWADPVEMRAARDRIADLLSTYGVDRHEVAGIVDARAIKFIEDARLLKEKYEKLRKGSVERQPTTAPPSTKKHTPNRDQRAQALADQGDKKGAISILLGG